jgi:hypothetical protein
MSSSSEIVFNNRDVQIKTLEKNFDSDDIVKIEIVKCKLDTDQLPGNLFNNSTNIKPLLVKQCGIKSLNKIIFEKLTKLEHLNVSLNQIKEFDKNLFQKCHFLQHASRSLTCMLILFLIANYCIKSEAHASG